MSGLVREVPEPSKHRVMGWALAAGPREVGQPHSSWMLAEQAAARGSSPSKGVRLGVAGEEEMGEAAGLRPLAGTLHAPLSLHWKSCASWTYWWGKPWAQDRWPQGLTLMGSM